MGFEGARDSRVMGLALLMDASPSTVLPVINPAALFAGDGKASNALRVCECDLALAWGLAIDVASW